MRGGVKTALLPMKSVFVNVKKGMYELSRWVAQKHTTKIAKTCPKLIKTSKRQHVWYPCCQTDINVQSWHSINT